MDFIPYLVSALSFIFIARFMVQLVNANFFNPHAQLLVKITKPILKPLAQIIPSKGNINWGCIITLIVLHIAALALVFSTAGTPFPSPVQLISWAILNLLKSVFQFFYVIAIVWALLSWLAMANRGAANPMYNLLGEILAPAIRPIDQVIPSLGGLSFSVLIFIIGLDLLQSGLIPFLARLIHYPGF